MLPEGTSRPSFWELQLDRHSFVPLYYQLQEALKQQIESGVWTAGDPLPSEPELARRFSVSRVVVRQALAILEDDRQIVRIRGRGTFVAQPKLDYRAGGLSRLLATPRGADVAVQVLDKRTIKVERSISEALEAGPSEDVARLTTLLSLRGVPLAISYSFFHRYEVSWLMDAAHVGRSLPSQVSLTARLCRSSSSWRSYSACATPPTRITSVLSLPSLRAGAKETHGPAPGSASRGAPGTDSR